MAEDVTELFAVIVEGATEDPILMECSGPGMGWDAAKKRLNELTTMPPGGAGRYFRGCIVRLEFADGNRAVMHAAATVRDGAPMNPIWQRKAPADG